MKKLIYVVLVFITMVAFSSCNKVENPLSEQSPTLQTDGQSTAMAMRIVVKEQRGGNNVVLIDDSYVIIGYGWGMYTPFYTTVKGSSYSADIYLDWDYGGTSSSDAAQFEISDTSHYVIITRYLYCDTNYSGSRSSTFSVNLNQAQQYNVRMNSTNGSNEDSKMKKD